MNVTRHFLLEWFLRTSYNIDVKRTKLLRSVQAIFHKPYIPSSDTNLYIYICIVYTGSRKKNAEFPECSSTSLELRLENLVTYKNMKETRHLENEFQVTVSHSRRFWWRGERIGKGRGRIVGESVARGHIR